ncbi:hypothetical protein DOTSEDRAFT_40648 [Dothistroma septosporum NZE10]|uniref:Uncharacterized protein n=1 Tax=Dothistroma septosporum (strain NZE10 / CBS 128990) TaxID=675120 RepID=N1Q196_DOTSN|nr:hypothetical protein DOTSEDRAFT_40648 [Dothistroma septosporum NZE10]
MSSSREEEPKSSGKKKIQVSSSSRGRTQQSDSSEDGGRDMPVHKHRVAKMEKARPSKKSRRTVSHEADSRTQKRSKHDDDASHLTPELERQQGSLYDAVAGRLSRDGFILSNNVKQPLPPDQALFNHKNAPTRYEENDMYFAHRNLPAGARLPDSDMLKTIHAYASDFYGSKALGDCHEDFKSMDETALIAVGVLLEEAAAHSLGKTGDLAFVQGQKRI